MRTFLQYLLRSYGVQVISFFLDLSRLNVQQDAVM